MPSAFDTVRRPSAEPAFSAAAFGKTVGSRASVETRASSENPGTSRPSPSLAVMVYSRPFTRNVAIASGMNRPRTGHVPMLLALSRSLGSSPAPGSE